MQCRDPFRALVSYSMYEDKIKPLWQSLLICVGDLKYIRRDREVAGRTVKSTVGV